jgi:hypothetical protein
VFLGIDFRRMHRVDALSLNGNGEKQANDQEQQ